MSRSVVIKMRKRLPTERVESFRRRLNVGIGAELRGRLAHWAAAVDQDVADAWPEMPEGVADRSADVWEPILAVADAAGGHWPSTGRNACTALVKVAENREGSLGVRLLGDLRRVFADAGTDRMATEEILERLHRLDESPWADMRGKALDARGLAYRVRQYEVRPYQFRIGEALVRGYSIPGHERDGGGLFDAFARYLPVPDPRSSVTSGTSVTPQVSDPESVTELSQVSESEWADLLQVTDVTDVTANRGSGTESMDLTSDCPVCGHAPRQRSSFGWIACEHQIQAVTV
jgi:hypothetical protein